MDRSYINQAEIYSRYTTWRTQNDDASVKTKSGRLEFNGAGVVSKSAIGVLIFRSRNWYRVPHWGTREPLQGAQSWSNKSKHSLIFIILVLNKVEHNVSLQSFARRYLRPLNNSSLFHPLRGQDTTILCYKIDMITQGYDATRTTRDGRY